MKVIKIFLLIIISIFLFYFIINCTGGDTTNGNNTDNDIDDYEDDFIYDIYEYVSTMEQLINAIGPNTSIEVTPGEYEIAITPEIEEAVNSNPYVTFLDVPVYGNGLKIINVKNLRIKKLTDDSGVVHIFTRKEELTVLILGNVENFVLDGVMMGHNPASNFCFANVIDVYDSKDVSIYNTDLYGSGLFGIQLNFVEGFEMVNSIIRECTYEIVDITDSNNVMFKDSRFHYNGILNQIIIVDSQVSFDNMSIKYNEALENEGALFHVLGSDVTLRNSVVKENQAKYFELVKDSVDYDDSNEIDWEQFSEGIYYTEEPEG